MTNVENVRVSIGGRPKGALAAAPRDPDKVLWIIRLRDEQHYRWREIAQIVGLSRQAPFLLHKRWREWAYVSGLIKKDQEAELDGTP